MILSQPTTKDHNLSDTKPEDYSIIKCGFDCTREKDSITRLADVWFGCTCSLLVSYVILYPTRKYIRRYVGSRISVSFGAI